MAHWGGSTYAELGRQYGFAAAYLYQVATGRRPASRRLLVALGLAQPERRRGVRVRMSAADAERIMRGDVPPHVRARVAGALAAKGER